MIEMGISCCKFHKAKVSKGDVQNFRARDSGTNGLDQEMRGGLGINE